ncbi:MAG: hypothetical protein ACOH2N_07240 [Devosia sp.]
MEPFKGEFGAECLKAHWFMNRDNARAKMGPDGNQVRLRNAIGNKPPITLVNCSAAAGPRLVRTCAKLSVWAAQTSRAGHTVFPVALQDGLASQQGLRRNHGLQRRLFSAGVSRCMS